jgi:hypothetical protein
MVKQTLGVDLPMVQKVTISPNTDYKLCFLLKIEKDTYGTFILDTKNAFDKTCKIGLNWMRPKQVNGWSLKKNLTVTIRKK